MRWIKFLLSLLLTLALAFVLLNPIGSTPFAFGSFFDPAQGFWQNAAPQASSAPESIDIGGLSAPVQVILDERSVPHIFAQSDHDLYFAQGYCVARDRLWQMEFQVRAASGRLSEILGAGPDSAILRYDRGRRRKGMVWAAERKLEEVMKDPLTAQAVTAYTAGVNAYINSLEPKDYPLEYKLIGYAPEAWAPLKTTILFMYVSDMLAGRAMDLPYTQALHQLGLPRFATLYPNVPVPNRQEPIIPKETRWLRRDAVPAPSTPPGYVPDSMLIAFGEQTTGRNTLASNNWVVGPQKSATGRPILANDMHLRLYMPSIWYEVQLHGPDHNVYGVTFIGAPGVIVGFNDSTAWGDTNGTRDVLDYFTIEFRSDKQKEYRYDGQWLPVQTRLERIEIKGQQAFTDTVRYTHHGPIMYDKAFGDQAVPLAVRWMAHEPSNELGTLLRFNRARNYKEYAKAMETFVCPSQNFVFASATGDIALWQAGSLVNRWPGQGRFVLDGTRKDHTWQSFVPQAEIPHVVNPPQAYIASTNQRPTSTFYPHYYTGRFNTYRSIRINELLRSQDTFSVADMKTFQLDVHGKLAEDVLPFLLTQLDTLTLSQQERNWYDKLKDWTFDYSRELETPTLFEIWWEDVKTKVFADETIQAPEPLPMPLDVVAIQLIKDSLELSYFRNVLTEDSMGRAELIRNSFNVALDSLERLSEKAWGNINGTIIQHMARLEPLGIGPLFTSGNGNILNATSSFRGPSWRMVVALGKEVEAWGVYPGGQSGDPSKPSYSEFIDDWVEGNYFPLHLMQHTADTSKVGPVTHLTFSPQAAE